MAKQSFLPVLYASSVSTVYKVGTDSWIYICNANAAGPFIHKDGIFAVPLIINITFIDIRQALSLIKEEIYLTIFLWLLTVSLSNFTSCTWQRP